MGTENLFRVTNRQKYDEMKSLLDIRLVRWTDEIVFNKLKIKF